jgi:DICT domain-containing protein
VHELVDEQRPGLLDVDLVGAALQRGQADDVLARRLRPCADPSGT